MMRSRENNPRREFLLKTNFSRFYVFLENLSKSGLATAPLPSEDWYPLWEVLDPSLRLLIVTWIFIPFHWISMPDEAPGAPQPSPLTYTAAINSGNHNERSAQFRENSIKYVVGSLLGSIPVLFLVLLTVPDHSPPPYSTVPISSTQTSAPSSGRDQTSVAPSAGIMSTPYIYSGARTNCNTSRSVRIPVPTERVSVTRQVSG